MDEVPNDQKIQFYSAARAEVTQRIALRDQTLIAYIVAAGAYLGLVAPEQASATLTSQNILGEIGLAAVPPIISLVFTYVILQHHVMIGTLGEYLRSLFPEGYNIWENFYVSSRDKRYLLARTFSQALLLTVPIIYTGAFIYRAIPVVYGNKVPTLALRGIFAFDILVIFLIVRQHLWAYGERCRTDRVKTQSPNGLGMQSPANGLNINEKRRPLGRTLLGLAVFRSCLGGLVLIAFRPQHPRLIAVCLVAFVLAEGSDLVDGAIARRFSRPTLAGYLQDSIADKIFNFGCLFALAGRFQWIEFFAWGLLIREFLILAARITDGEIANSLKRFKRHVVLYAVFVRSGIFGFFIASLNGGRTATIWEFLSYVLLAAGVVWGAINIIQMIFSSEPNSSTKTELLG
jgi:phosphatidylglycerophosphate synthase